MLFVFRGSDGKKPVIYFRSLTLFQKNPQRAAENNNVVHQVSTGESTRRQTTNLKPGRESYPSVIDSNSLTEGKFLLIMFDGNFRAEFEAETDGPERRPSTIRPLKILLVPVWRESYRLVLTGKSCQEFCLKFLSPRGRLLDLCANHQQF